MLKLENDTCFIIVCNCNTFTTATEYLQGLQLILKVLQSSWQILKEFKPAVNSMIFLQFTYYLIIQFISIQGHIFENTSVFILFLIKPPNVNKYNPGHKNLQYGEDHNFWQVKEFWSQSETLAKIM